MCVAPDGGAAAAALTVVIADVKKRILDFKPTDDRPFVLGTAPTNVRMVV